jgi:hypothetical protein
MLGLVEDDDEGKAQDDGEERNQEIQGRTPEKRLCPCGQVEGVREGGGAGTGSAASDGARGQQSQDGDEEEDPGGRTLVAGGKGGLMQESEKGIHRIGPCGIGRRGAWGGVSKGMGHARIQRPRAWGRGMTEGALGKDGLLPEMRLFWHRRRGSASG